MGRGGAGRRGAGRRGECAEGGQQPEKRSRRGDLSSRECSRLGAGSAGIFKLSQEKVGGGRGSPPGTADHLHRTGRLQRAAGGGRRGSAGGNYKSRDALRATPLRRPGTRTSVESGVVVSGRGLRDPRAGLGFPCGGRGAATLACIPGGYSWLRRAGLCCLGGRVYPRWFSFLVLGLFVPKVAVWGNPFLTLTYF